MAATAEAGPIFLASFSLLRTVTSPCFRCPFGEKTRDSALRAISFGGFR